MFVNYEDTVALGVFRDTLEQAPWMVEVAAEAVEGGAQQQQQLLKRCWGSCRTTCERCY